MKKIMLFILIQIIHTACKQNQPSIEVRLIYADTEHHLIDVVYINHSDTNYFIPYTKLRLYDSRGNLYMDAYNDMIPTPKLKQPSAQLIAIEGYQNYPLQDTFFYAWRLEFCKMKQQENGIQENLDSCVKANLLFFKEIDSQIHTADSNYYFILLPKNSKVINRYKILYFRQKDTINCKIIFPFNPYIKPKKHVYDLQGFSTLTQHTGFYLYRGNIKSDSVWVKF